MNILISIVLGLIGGVLAFSLGGALASFLTAACHWSAMDGGRGYFAGAVGLLTGLAGMIATIMTALRRRSATGLIAGLGVALASLACLGLLAAAGFGLYYVSIPHPIHSSGPPVYLKFEIMAPDAEVAPDFSTWEVEMNTDKNGATGYWDRDAHIEVDGKPVAAGLVELYYRTRQRLLVLKMPNQESRIFRLPLPADPTAARFRRWSEWRKADFADIPGQGVPKTRAVDYLVRYQVETNAEPRF